MDYQLLTLITAAAGIGFLHTLLGPDHYVPFIALSKARHWTIKKTAFITVVCGLAHIGSSFIIGFLGIKLSYQLTRLEAFEALRGSIAGWLIIAFGLAYLVWGIKKAVTAKKEKKIMEELEETPVNRNEKKSYKQLLPWILFIVFLFGPCEPLIPLLMFPAANINLMSLMLVAGIFGATTIITMLVMVVLPLYGIHKVRFPSLKIYDHALAGMLILLCGIGMQFLGL